MHQCSTQSRDASSLKSLLQCFVYINFPDVAVLTGFNVTQAFTLQHALILFTRGHYHAHAITDCAGCVIGVSCTFIHKACQSIKVRPLQRTVCKTEIAPSILLCVCNKKKSWPNLRRTVTKLSVSSVPTNYFKISHQSKTISFWVSKVWKLCFCFYMKRSRDFIWPTPSAFSKFPESLFLFSIWNTD